METLFSDLVLISLLGLYLTVYAIRERRRMGVRWVCGWLSVSQFTHRFVISLGVTVVQATLCCIVQTVMVDSYHPF